MSRRPHSSRIPANAVQPMSPEEWLRVQQIRRQYQANDESGVAVPPGEAIAFLLSLMQAGRIDPPAGPRTDPDLVRRNQIALPIT